MSNAKQPVVVVVGTRPEGIKMAPVYWALRNAGYHVILLSTMQHSELLNEVFTIFGMKPDFDLGVMRLDQDLFYLTQSVLQKTKNIFTQIKPKLVLVQGDTTSTMAAALAAFYLKIPIGHVEAGLRTYDLYAPFPEEMNRHFVSTIAQLHFAPTEHAVDNLSAEQVAKNRIFCTGNTVVDALRILCEKIDDGSVEIATNIVDYVAQCKTKHQKIMLLTVHRRESFGSGIERILTTVKNFLQEHQDVFCFYPYHPNPNVIRAIEKVQFSSLSNTYLCEPFAYKELVFLLRVADIILTDSGGIQEEAISLGKHVIVLREKTERMEGVWAGMAHVVGADTEKIQHTMQDILERDVGTINPNRIYGDGYAAQKIVEIIEKQYSKQDREKNDCTSDDDLGSVQNGAYKQEAAIENNVLVSGAEVRSVSEKDRQMKKVCVVGLGYIGLPTAIILADSGFDVVGFDVDVQRVQRINQGDPVIQEPEIYEKLQTVLSSKQLQAVIEMPKADYFIIAVPTPLKENKQADVSAVFAAAEQICEVLKKGNVVILESTVPVGTTQKLAEFLEKRTALKVGIDIFVSHCPERVLPGKIFKELVENSRVIGGLNRICVEQAQYLYKYFVQGALYLTNAATAEMVKLVENSLRDVEIAFAHQVAAMADAAGLNPYEVIELANMHPRVNILRPTAGVGGHCIAIDPWFLVQTFKNEATLLHTARIINEQRPQTLVKKIKDTVASWQMKNTGTCTILLLGATYKPNVDDLRESPALSIAKTLIQEKVGNLLVCEPYVNKESMIQHVGDCVVKASDGLEVADVVVYLVAHRRFKAIDRKLLRNKIVLDFCGLLYKGIEEAGKQEHLFWPARSILDIFISNQEPSQERNP
ncbi:UDP-N-acetylglucosamine 2-epimerase (non-hydrolyzing) [Candidatus Dependentiae bacterium]|nr:UDP-N-acetylglucosamine 2-epimerase (non-hydrolyzing) [Candidatus Dependentiae bacterium]